RSKRHIFAGRSAVRDADGPAGIRREVATQCGLRDFGKRAGPNQQRQANDPAGAGARRTKMSRKNSRRPPAVGPRLERRALMGFAGEPRSRGLAGSKPAPAIRRAGRGDVSRYRRSRNGALPRPLTRFALALPPGKAAPMVTWPALAISPDGTQLV